MPTASFRFGRDLKHECQIVCGHFGSERYLVDGKLIHKHWTLSPSGTREFSAYGHHIKVQLVVNLQRVDAKAFVDEALVAEDLFSEINEGFARKRQSGSFLLKVVVWLVIALAFFSAFKAFDAAT